MQNVHVAHPLGLQIALQFSTPLLQERVPGLQQFIGLSLGLQFGLQQFGLQLILSLPIGQCVFSFVQVAFEFEYLFLECGNFVVEGVLLGGVGGFEFAHFLAVAVPESADFLQQVRDFSVLEGDLCLQYFSFCVLVLDGGVEVVEFGLGVVLDLLHGGGVVLEFVVAFRLHGDDLLAQHLHGVLLFGCQLLVLPLEGSVLAAQQFDFLLLLADFAPQGVDGGVVDLADVVPLGLGLGEVLVVLRLEAGDGVVEFEFVFALDGEDLVLEFGDQQLEGVFGVLVVLQLSLVAGGEEVDFVVLLPEGFVEVVDLLHQGLLDQLAQSAHVAQPVLGLPDQILPAGACPVLAAGVGLSEFLAQSADEGLEPVDFCVLLPLDVFEFVGECAFDGFLEDDRALEFADFALQFLLLVAVLLPEALHFPREAFLEGFAFLLALGGGLRAEFLLLAADVLAGLLLGFQFGPEGAVVEGGLFLVCACAFEFAAGAFEFVASVEVVGDGLLVFLEEEVVFDFVVLGLGEAELGDAQVVLQPRDLHLVAVDLPHVELHVVAGRRVPVQLSLRGLAARGLLALVAGGSLRPRGAVGAAVVLFRGGSLRHLTLILFKSNLGVL